MAKKKEKPVDDRTALDASQTAELAWYSSQFQEHPVIGLTPTRLHQLLTEAESGNLSAQADLFADMEERDGHIFSELDKRKKGVNGLDWGIKPPKRATPAEKKLAEEVHEWVDDIEDLELVFLDALDGIGHGYSGQEIQWHKMGKLWLPASFEHSLARNFQTPANAPNELRFRDGSGDGAELWDYNWFMHRHKAKSGYISRQGLFRILSWPFLFKNYSVRDVLEFLEIYGLPSKIGKYPVGATAEEKATLKYAIMCIGRNAGGIIPHGMSIEFEAAASGDTDNHMNFIKWCEGVQSKVIVGGTLLSQADGKTSTHAQSQTHEIQFEKIIKSDAKQLARSFSNTVINYMMRLNYPNISPDRYPKFYFETTDTEDIQVFSDSLPKLVGVGMRIPLAWAHEKLGIPQPEDDSVPVLGVAQPTPLLAVNSQNFKGFKLAALTQQVKDNLFNDQVLLDQAINELEAGDLQSQSRAIIDSVLKQLESAATPEDALGILANISPDASTDVLQTRLGQLLFAAETWGAINAQVELE